ncbi:hypothetical protein ACHAXS_009296, partial [Conticribra weissflogii]
RSTASATASASSRRSLSSPKTNDAAAAAAAAPPPPTFSPYDFPERSEAPVITRTRAADLSRTPSPVEPPADPPVAPPNSQPISSAPPFAALSAAPARRPRAPTTEITALPNGVRVGSVETPSSVSTVGVLLDCGSRHERLLRAPPPGEASTAGVNHLLELLAFQSSLPSVGLSSASLRNNLDGLGAATFANSSREQMMYCVDVLRPNAEAAFDLLAEVVKCPDVQREEVDEMKKVMDFQLTDVVPQILLGEGLQMAAYGPLNDPEHIDDDDRLQQLGRPHFCTAEALPLLTPDSVRLFKRQNLLHNPKGIVVAGSGIEHDALVDWARRHFGDVTDDVVTPTPRTVPSTYTGGEHRLPTPLHSLYPDKPQYTHVALAFEAPRGWHSPRLVPLCVLQTLLGGGSSFSAGGPGKGMYSKLYREILNRYSWVESAEAFSSFHAESGLWGISGSCRPDKAGDLTRAMIAAFVELSQRSVTEEELQRAKNMLKCNVLTQLESRLVSFEDIGRQILTYGRREEAEAMCERIDAVTREDIVEVVGMAVGTTRPTMSAVGVDISRVPTFEEVEAMLSEKSTEKRSVGAKGGDGGKVQKQSWFS